MASDEIHVPDGKETLTDMNTDDVQSCDEGNLDISGVEKLISSTAVFTAEIEEWLNEKDEDPCPLSSSVAPKTTSVSTSKSFASGSKNKRLKKLTPIKKIKKISPKKRASSKKSLIHKSCKKKAPVLADVLP